MNIEIKLKQEIQTVLSEIFQIQEECNIQPTKKEFEGDYTFVVFPLVKALKKNPLELGNQIGQRLMEISSIASSFNVVQGFLNIVLKKQVWIESLNGMLANEKFGELEKDKGAVMVEFSSPNTNKPLHLGHLRNNFLGDSVSKILDAAGYEVTKSCLVNDRGIHICKSMLAYEKYGNNATPESLGIKGDHLAGKFYVEFDKAYKQEINELIEKGISEEEAKKNAPLMKEAQEMLQKWENGDEATISLWKKMNQWVFDGFAETYQTIGINFDKTYYESNTYLLGKDIVEEGLEKEYFLKKKMEVFG